MGLLHEQINTSFKKSFDFEYQSLMYCYFDQQTDLELYSLIGTSEGTSCT